MRALVLALAVGCYHPAAVTDVPCSPEGTCPTNQLCDVRQSPAICVDSIETLPDASPSDTREVSIDAPSDAATTIPPGAAMWLRFDDSPVNGVTDSAGTHVVTCTTCPDVVAGVHGSAYQFSTDSLTVETAADLEPSSQAGFTIAAWVRLDTPSNTTAIIACKTYNGTSCTYGLLTQSNNRPYFYSPNANILGVTPLPLATWHHLALTYNGGTLTGYVDGIAVGSKDGQIPSDPTLGLTIGGRAGTSALSWGGAIDDLLVYQRVLTTDEITGLAQAP